MSAAHTAMYESSKNWNFVFKKEIRMQNSVDGSSQKFRETECTLKMWLFA